jgi:hypothetical protein
MSDQVPFTYFLVEAENPERLDDTLQGLPQMRARVVGRGTPSGILYIEGHPVVKVFGDASWFERAVETQGYCKLIKQVEGLAFPPTHAYALLAGRVDTSQDLPLLDDLIAASPATLRAMLATLQEPVPAGAKSSPAEGEEVQDLTLLTLANASVVGGKLVLPKPTMLFYRVEGYTPPPAQSPQLETCRREAALLTQQLVGEGRPAVSALVKYHPLYHITLALMKLQRGHQVRFMKETRPDILSLERTVGPVVDGLEDEPEETAGPRGSEQH